MTKKILYFSLFIVIIGFSCANDNNSNNKDLIIIDDSIKINSKNIVLDNCNPTIEPFFILEYFSNEGCEGCAKTEPIFNSLIEYINSQPSSPNILAISLHIAYGNHDGWIDIYGLKSVDTLHENYCKKLNSSTYTPLVVMNGKSIGPFDQTFIQNNIQYWLQQKYNAGICLEQESFNDTTLTINYTYKNNDTINSSIRFYLLENDIYTNVTSGDNAGKRLHHLQMAREIKVIKNPNNNGQITFNIPSDADKSKLLVAAYIFNTNTYEVLGGNRVLYIK